MGLNETTAAGWWLHSAIGGGLLLLVAALLMARTRQPARRQRLGVWGAAAALLVAALALAPAWLLLPVPTEYQPKPQAVAAPVEERQAPPALEPPQWVPDDAVAA